MFYPLFMSPLLSSPRRSNFNPQTKRARHTVVNMRIKKNQIPIEVPAIFALPYIDAAVLLNSSTVHCSGINPFNNRSKGILPLSTGLQIKGRKQSAFKNILKLKILGLNITGSKLGMSQTYIKEHEHRKLF